MRYMYALCTYGMAVSLLVSTTGGCSKSTVSVDGTTTSTTGASHATETAATTSPSATHAANAKGFRMEQAPESEDLLSMIRIKRARAQTEGRILVIYIGAKWCPPCRAFHKAIDAGEVDSELPRTTLLAFDIDRDGERLGAAGYGSQFIPAFALVGPDGHKQKSFDVKTMDGAAAVKEAVAGIAAWQPSAK